MSKKHIPHSFLTLGDLKSFNESVSDGVIDNNTEVEKSIPYDPTKFESVIVDPVDVNDEVMLQLADIIDKKTQLDQRDYTAKAFKAPNTLDRLLKADKIAYIMENGIPVAVASIVDAKQENYMGIIPADFYALKAAMPLNDYMHQEFFTVVDEKKDMGLSGELRRLLESIAPKMFITIPVTDKDTLTGVANNGYKFVSEFETDWEVAPVQLWMN